MPDAYLLDAPAVEVDNAGFHSMLISWDANKCVQQHTRALVDHTLQQCTASEITGFEYACFG